MDGTEALLEGEGELVGDAADVLLVSVEHAVVTAISRTATTAIGRRFIGAG
ncbi:hypothetical protein [Kribbella soli]|uniref:hypothetical protein n=1 Tax=Kribbella soli TaxID=1124743 RepID=UPI00192E0243|nr:hypothetical protein [Kribbella soli]